MFGLLLLITFGDNGVIELYQLKSKRDRIIESNEKIELENRALIRRGDRLKYDRKFYYRCYLNLEIFHIRYFHLRYC